MNHHEAFGDDSSIDHRQFDNGTNRMTSIFLNGIIGVFAGMAMLYVTMKIIAFVVERTAEKPD